MRPPDAQANSYSKGRDIGRVLDSPEGQNQLKRQEKFPLLAGERHSVPIEL
jgi:hypothetical protein